MGIEDVFNGTKNGLSVFGAYFNTVATEIGMEQVLSLLTKMFETRLIMLGKSFKEQAVVAEFDAKAILPLVKDSFCSSGIVLEMLEESPTAVRTGLSLNYVLKNVGENALSGLPMFSAASLVRTRLSMLKST